MRNYPHICARLLNTPLLIEAGKHDAILEAVGPRLGLGHYHPSHTRTTPTGQVIVAWPGWRMERPIGDDAILREFEALLRIDDFAGPDATPGADYNERAPIQAHIDGEVRSNQPFRLTDRGVAIIDVTGTLVHRSAAGARPMSALSSYADIERDLQLALADQSVRAILFDFDSGGGEVEGVESLAALIFESRDVKPIWASADEVAFSAAYVLASGASRITVPKTGAVGSIGVMAVHLDISERDRMEGFNFTTIFAGARKNDLNPHEPLSDEARERLQADVDGIYDLFIEVVARHRAAMSAAQVRATEAATFAADEAIEIGLVDAVMPFRETLAELTASLDGSTERQPVSGAAPTAKPMAPERSEVMSNDARNPGADTGRTGPAEVTENAAPQAADAGGSAAEVVNLDAARQEGARATAEIVELCAMMKRPDLAAGFIRDGKTAEEVRTHFIDARAAEDEGETTGAHSADAKPAKGAMVESMKRVLAQHGLKPTEAIYG